MNWDSRIETAEADYAQAKKDLADGRGDIELVKGCLAYLTSLVIMNWLALLQQVKLLYLIKFL